MQEYETKTASASCGSGWNTAWATISKQCSAGKWIVSMATKGDGQGIAGCSCSHATVKYYQVDVGRWSVNSCWLAELSNDGTITVKAGLSGNDNYGASLNTTVAFIKIG